jgi:hypothetical protein
MRLFGKLLWRMMLASLILALPQVALASSDDGALTDEESDGLVGIVDQLSDEAVENLLFGMMLSGCFERNPVTFVNPWYGSSF